MIIVKKRLCLWMTFILLFVFNFNSFLYATPLSTTEEAAIQIKGVMDLIEKNYVGEEVSIQQLLDGALKGIFNTLDDYSTYYTEEEYQKFTEGVSGEFIGIGVEMKKYPNHIEITRVFPDSPAQKAGIQAGDHILEVEGEPVSKYTFDQISKKIRGPINTQVILTLKRGNQQVKASVIRQPIKINPITMCTLSELLKEESNEELSSLLYVQISEFNGQTVEAFDEVLEYVEKNQIKGILFDVRNNPGGILSQVIQVCKKIIPKGPIVYTINKNGDHRVAYSYLEKASIPMVVLVNEYSASAAEIFASALQDSGVGKLVGEKTFGKGIVQRLYQNKNGGYFKMTTEEYLTRNKNHIHGKGIEPDFQVEGSYLIDKDNPEQTKKDVQLKKGYEVLRKWVHTKF